MHRGWVRLWRKEKESRVFKNERLWKVYTWCRMKASHKERWISVTTGKGKSEVLLKPGEFLFGRKSAAMELDMAPSTVWYQMRKLRSMGRITIRSDRHYSIVTARDHKKNQIKNNEIEQPTDSQPTANRQPTDTKKNGKNVQNEKIDMAQQAEDLFSRYPRNIDRANSIKSIINELKSGTPLEDIEAALENYLAIIRRDGTEPKFVIGSKEFFAGRWKEYKDGSVPQSFQTGEASRYNYLKCCNCPTQASNVEIKEDGLPYCVFCWD